MPSAVGGFEITDYSSHRQRSTQRSSDCDPRLELSEAVVAKRGERNRHGDPVVVANASVREFDFGEEQSDDPQ